MPTPVEKKGTQALRPATPEVALDHYMRALQAGDYKAAVARMARVSERFRLDKPLPIDNWVILNTRQVTTDDSLRAKWAEPLTTQDVELTVRQTFNTGVELTYKYWMRETPEGWKVFASLESGG